MQDSDSGDTMMPSSALMGHISPDQLPELLRSRMEQQGSLGLGGALGGPSIPGSNPLAAYQSLLQFGGGSLGKLKRLFAGSDSAE